MPFNSVADDPAEWLQAEHGLTLTPFQHRVMWMLGIISGGIHNAPIDWSSVDWQYGNGGMAVIWTHGHLSTIDTCKLTWLVFMCCDARIRLQIGAHGRATIKLQFWQRQDRGRQSQEHPDLDQFVAEFRQMLPPDHMIHYRNHPERATDNGAADQIVPT